MKHVPYMEFRIIGTFELYCEWTPKEEGEGARKELGARAAWS